MDTTEQDLLADELAMRAWQVLGDRDQVKRWLGGASALAGGDTPIDACATPEVRRRMERQLDWFAGGPTGSSVRCGPASTKDDRGPALIAPGRPASFPPA